jgi:hypothetical protein
MQKKALPQNSRLAYLLLLALIIAINMQSKYFFQGRASFYTLRGALGRTNKNKNKKIKTNHTILYKISSSQFSLTENRRSKI